MKGMQNERYAKWNKVIFLLDKKEVQCTEKGLDKPVSKANYKKQSMGIINPQSCSSSNRASMDGTGDGREEEVEMPNP